MSSDSPDHVAHVVSHQQSRALDDAPESLVLEAIALWDKRPRPQVESTMRRVLTAVLSFDSLKSGIALAGVRAPDDDARQLLFSVDGLDIDLRIKRCTAVPAAGWTVCGQVLGPEQAGRTRIRCGEFEASVEWSDLCEFHLEPVPDGECVVSLETDEWEVVLPPFALPPPS